MVMYRVAQKKDTFKIFSPQIQQVYKILYLKNFGKFKGNTCASFLIKLQAWGLRRP